MNIDTTKEINAALRQQLPTGDGRDVAEYVVKVLGSYAFENAATLIPDIEARVASGEKKYGTRLKTNNGRDSLLDLYQEVLDGINYSAQNILEHADEGDAVVQTYVKIFNELVDLAVRIKALMLAR